MTRQTLLTFSGKNCKKGFKNFFSLLPKIYIYYIYYLQCILKLVIYKYLAYNFVIKLSFKYKLWLNCDMKFFNDIPAKQDIMKITQYFPQVVDEFCCSISLL